MVEAVPCDALVLSGEKLFVRFHFARNYVVKIKLRHGSINCTIYSGIDWGFDVKNASILVP